MKRTAFLLAALLVIVSSRGLAQESIHHPTLTTAERWRLLDRGKLERNYLYAFGSDNNGVVESAIAQVIKMKMVMPDVEFDGLKGGLGRLSVNGRTAPIRYKAFLAGLVIDNLSIFAMEKTQRYSSDEELFSAISDRLRSELLGRNVKYVFQE